MEQAEKPIRVRNAGDTCVLWPVRLTPDLARVLCIRDARTHLRAPRARRFAQSFRTPLRDRKGNRRPANPVAGVNTGR